MAEFDNSLTGSVRMFVFLSKTDLESNLEGNLDLIQQIFVIQIFEFTKSLKLASN